MKEEHLQDLFMDWSLGHSEIADQAQQFIHEFIWLGFQHHFNTLSEMLYYTYDVLNDIYNRTINGPCMNGECEDFDYDGYLDGEEYEEGEEVAQTGEHGGQTYRASAYKEIPRRRRTVANPIYIEK